MEGEYSKKKRSEDDEEHLFHVIYKVPSADGPYGRAKHAQLVQKDPEAALVWFWKAINAGDRVDSALKDMAVVMKQLDRTEEAIEAIKSFRVLCSRNSQESIDNILLDLYKKCGRIDEQIALLKQKLRSIYRGEAFNGRPTKTARSHGKKFQVSVKQETSRLLGNLGWAYMQKSNYMAAEVVYKKAQMIDPDDNKACNLAFCLMKRARYDEARSILKDILLGRTQGAEAIRTRSRAQELLTELENETQMLPLDLLGLDLDEDFVDGLERLMNAWAPSRSRRLPIFEEISTSRDQLAC
ncbi:hypothetical protein DCAR_0105132 [Daucus carota subsp. sativus]|uniref:Protein SULFUR DEFICIENCY-INDUCED 1 n=1 Tax=Daucus carota subsp. sativus TaxID=79200 RepID=A0AAF0WAE2_DAUCS|nr:PREDICTED: protein SULFUR DEFICIENCY-INDUCED 1-like isoform X2 [Daucus carota subsp. sativus]WOG85939.1 hypothetical protein DCAR_0105132 [Daucus carota subsp. sativus]